MALEAGDSFMMPIGAGAQAFHFKGSVDAWE